MGTSENSTGQGCLPLKFWPEASPARTFRSAIKAAWESQVYAAASGESMRDSLVFFDRATSSWKTSQICLTGELDEFSGTWPRSGTMRNGNVFPRVPLEASTNEIGFGLWPTPRGCGGGRGVCWKRATNGEHRSNLEDFIAWLWLREGNVRAPGYHVNPTWLDWYQGYPIGWTDLKDSETPSSQP